VVFDDDREETVMTRRKPCAAVLVWAAAALAGCSGQPSADTPRIEEKTFSLNPATIPVRVGILDGQLSELSVVQRVNVETGEVIYAPQMRGTLKLKNDSSDESVRLLDGEIEYLDAAGGRIALANTRSDTSFQFYSYSSDRLDPGAEVSHSVDVPFPAAALKDKTLKEIRLSVTYLPAPYREESVKVPVTVAVR
jgi:hypothetical protein